MRWWVSVSTDVFTAYECGDGMQEYKFKHKCLDILNMEKGLPYEGRHAPLHCTVFRPTESNFAHFDCVVVDPSEKRVWLYQICLGTAAQHMKKTYSGHDKEYEASIAEVQAACSRHWFVRPAQGEKKMSVTRKESEGGDTVSLAEALCRYCTGDASIRVEVQSRDATEEEKKGGTEQKSVWEFSATSDKKWDVKYIYASASSKKANAKGTEPLPLRGVYVLSAEQYPSLLECPHDHVVGT